MIDIHCHIIYDVDDGAKTIDDSIKMALEAKKVGIDAIVCSPHYNESLWSSERILDNFYQTKAEVKKCGIELFLGYEVFLCNFPTEILSGKRKYTLHDSNYLLFELPPNIVPIDLNQNLHKMLSYGYIPIIAHPERNICFIRNIEKLMDLVKAGCLVQVDASSIVGIWGSDVKKFAKKLIKKNLVHFAASDAHRPGDYSEWYLQAYKNVKKWSGKEYCDRIFMINQNKILGISDFED